MGKLFVLYIIAVITDSPLLVLLMIFGLVYVAESQLKGRFYNPAGFFISRRNVSRLRTIVERNPHDAKAQSELGRLLADRGQFQEAAEALNTALKKLQNRPEVHFNLGRAQLGLDDYESGRASIDRALELRPQLQFGEPDLAIAEYLYGQERYAEALAHYQKSVALNRSNCEAHFKLGRCLAKLERTDDAQQAWSECRRAHRQSPSRKRYNRRWSWAAFVVSGITN